MTPRNGTIFGGTTHLESMKLAIGSDHAGFPLKEYLENALEQRDITLLDKGTNSIESTDYPTYAHAVADSVGSGEADLGVVICGSGNGVNITANKHAGVRSALAWDPEVAALARQHNNANVLALPARFISENLALDILERFLEAKFEGGRHARRVNGIEKT